MLTHGPPSLPPQHPPPPPACRVQQFTAAGALLAATDAGDGSLSYPVGIAALTLAGVPARTVLVADSSLDAVVVYTREG